MDYFCCWKCIVRISGFHAESASQEGIEFMKASKEVMVSLKVFI